MCACCLGFCCAPFERLTRKKQIADRERRIAAFEKKQSASAGSSTRGVAACGASVASDLGHIRRDVIVRDAQVQQARRGKMFDFKGMLSTSETERRVLLSEVDSEDV